MVHDRTADVLEVDVDQVRGRGVELGAPVRRAVIDAGVESELVDHVRALLGPACDAHHAGAALLRELARDRPDRPARGRHDHGLALSRPAEQLDPEPGGDAGVAEGPEERLERAGQRIGQHGQPRDRSSTTQVLLPAGEAAHERADGQLGVARLDDLADAEPPHHVVDRHRRHVATDLAHPDAVRGIERQPQDADDRLAVPRLGNGLLDQFEVAGPKLAVGATSQPVDAIRAGGHPGSESGGAALGYPRSGDGCRPRQRGPPARARPAPSPPPPARPRRAPPRCARAGSGGAAARGARRRAGRSSRPRRPRERPPAASCRRARHG